MAAKIRKDDVVQVIAGKDKGTTGKVLKVITEKDRVLVEGVNVVTKHNRASQTNAGGIEETEAPIHISNVMLVDPESNKPTRVGFREEKNDEGKTVRVRVAKSTGKDID
ncbi:MAG: 50S ribosomal protein L24 [Micrococcaceae bacterium]